MSWQPLGLILLCAANLSLGTLVILHDPSGRTNRLFLLSVLVIVGWTSCISLAFLSGDLRLTVVLGRLAFAFATAMPPALLWLFLAFRPPDQLAGNRGLAVAAAICLVFVCLSLSPLIVADATSGQARPNFIYGPLHPLLGVYLVGCFSYALYTLSWITNAATGLRKLQLRYLLTGVLLAGLGVSVTNLLIPLIWQTSHYGVFGPYFTLVFVSFSAHAIIRHRLMDIRFFARKGVVYVSALAVASVAFLGVAGLTTSITGQAADNVPLTVAVIIALTVSIFFQPLKDLIQASLNRYLYRATYDYQRTLREASRRLSTILDLQSLLAFLTDVIARTLKSEVVAVYLPTGSGGQFVAHAVTHQSNVPSVHLSDLSADSSLLTLLRDWQRPLFREIARDDEREAHRKAARELQQLGGEVALPFLENGLLSGVLVVGPRLSGDPYLSDDMDLISTLTGQAAIAMKNAHLYREVVLANERIENILETMDNALVAVTDTGTITLFNSAAERMTGLSVADVKGRSVKTLPPELASPIEATLRDSHLRVQAETTVRHRSGRLTPAIYSTSTMRDRSGAVFGVVAVFSDLTRLRELETEKRRTERLASIGAFAANMAHEIKNPLVAIKTFAELLPERFTEEDFRDQFSKVAIKEIERIDELVGRLRGLVTHQPKQLAPVRISALVEDVLSLLRGQLEQARINATTLYDDPLPTVAGDQAQLRQLLLNVLMNAVEAMPQGGDLTVSLSHRDSSEPNILTIEVRDTGQGIPNELLEKIFDPFVTTKSQGSGLGLSICQGIIEAHRGTIVAANNTPDPGATITLGLPITRDTSATVDDM
jgi:PAS domain S-box-containing protein